MMYIGFPYRNRNIGLGNRTVRFFLMMPGSLVLLFIPALLAFLCLHELCPVNAGHTHPAESSIRP